MNWEMKREMEILLISIFVEAFLFCFSPLSEKPRLIHLVSAYLNKLKLFLTRLSCSIN